MFKHQPRAHIRGPSWVTVVWKCNRQYSFVRTKASSAYAFAFAVTV
jgi:hypothetical protein